MSGRASYRQGAAFVALGLVLAAVLGIVSSIARRPALWDYSAWPIRARDIARRDRLVSFHGKRAGSSWSERFPFFPRGTRE